MALEGNIPRKPFNAHTPRQIVERRTGATVPKNYWLEPGSYYVSGLDAGNAFVLIPLVAQAGAPSGVTAMFSQTPSAFGNINMAFTIRKPVPVQYGATGTLLIFDYYDEDHGLDGLSIRCDSGPSGAGLALNLPIAGDWSVHFPGATVPPGITLTASGLYVYDPLPVGATDCFATCTIGG